MLSSSFLKWVNSDGWLIFYIFIGISRFFWDFYHRFFPHSHSHFLIDFISTDSFGNIPASIHLCNIRTEIYNPFIIDILGIVSDSLEILKGSRVECSFKRASCLYRFNTCKSIFSFSPISFTASAQCQQNALLSKLLLQLLISTIQSIQTTTQHPLIPDWSQLLKSSQTDPNQAATTVLTTTVISTVTQLFSSSLNIIFRNRRIPTTIYSSSVFQVTELKTITSTLHPSTNRIKRDNEDVLQFNHVDSSFLDVTSHDIQPTQPLPSHQSAQFEDYPIDADQLEAILNHPQLQEAWASFLQVFNKLYFND